MREVPSQWFQSAGARFLPSTDMQYVPSILSRVSHVADLHAHTMPSSNLHTSCPQVICTLQMVCTLQVVRPPSSKVYQGTYDYLPGGVRRQPQWTLIGRSLDARWTLQWTLQWTLRKWYLGHDFLCLRIKSFFLLEKCLLTPHIQNATPGSVFAVSTVVSTVASNERPVSAQ